MFLTDTPGILRDKHDPDSLYRELTPEACRDLIDQGIVDKGMIPKVEACIACIDAGVRKVHIVDGRLRHALLLEIFTHEGIGTQIASTAQTDSPTRRAAVALTTRGSGA